MKKFLSLALSLVMVLSMSTLAFAAEDNEVLQPVPGSTTTGISDVTFEVVKADEVIIATLPVEIPLVANTMGEVTVPTDLKIINNVTDRDIRIVSATWHSEDTIDELGAMDWSDVDLESMTHRCLALEFEELLGGECGYFTSDGQKVDTTFEYLSELGWVVPANTAMGLTIRADVSKPLYATETAQYILGTISFVIGFADEV